MADNDTHVIDLDAVRAAHREKNPPSYRVLRLYGRDWKIRPLPNVFTLLDMTEGGSQAQFLLGYVDATQRSDFEKALREDEDLDEEMLTAIMDALMNQETGRPTVPSPSSEGSSSPDGTTSTETSSSEEAPADSVI